MLKNIPIQNYYFSPFFFTYDSQIICVCQLSTFLQFYSVNRLLWFMSIRYSGNQKHLIHVPRYKSPFFSFHSTLDYKHTRNLILRQFVFVIKKYICLCSDMKQQPVHTRKSGITSWKKFSTNKILTIALLCFIWCFWNVNDLLRLILYVMLLRHITLYVYFVNVKNKVFCCFFFFVILRN